MFKVTRGPYCWSILGGSHPRQCSSQCFLARAPLSIHSGRAAPWEILVINWKPLTTSPSAVADKLSLWEGWVGRDHSKSSYFRLALFQIQILAIFKGESILGNGFGQLIVQLVFKRRIPLVLLTSCAFIRLFKNFARPEENARAMLALEMASLPHSGISKILISPVGCPGCEKVKQSQDWDSNCLFSHVNAERQITSHWKSVSL